eukprot:3392748-Amphidinium_carterae.2
MDSEEWTRPEHADSMKQRIEQTGSGDPDKGSGPFDELFIPLRILGVPAIPFTTRESCGKCERIVSDDLRISLPRFIDTSLMAFGTAQKYPLSL